MAGVPRMRTVQQCAAYFKEQDPGCCIGEWCIRQVVNQGKIPVVRSGRRILINLDLLIAYFSGVGGEEPEAALVVSEVNKKTAL